MWHLRLLLWRLQHHAQMWLWGAAAGAVVGVLVAGIDLVVNGRYVLANRTQAKLRREREQARRQPPDDAA
jgi:hypothetical protein